MTEIKNLKVYGLDEAVIRSGFPLRTNEPEIKEPKLEDYDRLQKLAKAKIGTGHNNALKGIIVQFDIKYPQYLTPQLQRYHWFEIISSQSKMHCLTKGKFECNKYVSKYIEDEFKRFIEIYNEDSDYENFMRCISNCPMGLEMWMGITTNYLQLKTIYHQRKNHRLKEDWGEICRVIESLPYFEEFIK